ncbi:hypothetical protein EAE99_000889 [Botrytis elliptica]|nr:hypothetical protein EAE99_000889 [Botrytis elliptica]
MANTGSPHNVEHSRDHRLILREKLNLVMGTQMADYKRFGECEIVDLHPGRQPCANLWIKTKDFTALHFMSISEIQRSILGKGRTDPYSILRYTSLACAALQFFNSTRLKTRLKSVLRTANSLYSVFNFSQGNIQSAEHLEDLFASKFQLSTLI